MEDSNKNMETLEVRKLLPRSRRRIYFAVFALVIFTGLGLSLFYFSGNKQDQSIVNGKLSMVEESQTATPTLPPIPSSKILSNGGYHIFQSFNNCGPASLSMALRFYGINKSQTEIGQSLRPYQVAGGDNDDKSVTLEELAKKGEEYGFIPYHRPMGNPDIVKQFIANDMPVIARTWTKPDEDIGHYRVIKGYDESSGTYLQDDSLQNKNLTYTYADFNEIWKKFNYEYLVLVPAGQQELAETILGENIDKKIAWQRAVENSLSELTSNPNDIDARFNLSVAYYNVGEYEKSVEEFEKVESLLPFRTLWYQIEPIEAYYELSDYDRVFQITDRVLNFHNRAFSELYIIRGKIYQSQGKTDLARQEFQNAVLYNSSLQEAQDLLNSI
jgi:hypothetical protein